MRNRPRIASFVIVGLPALLGSPAAFGQDAAHERGAVRQQVTARASAPTIDGSLSSHFEVMKAVMNGDWVGRFTNGTFEEPTEWRPVRVEYRRTSGGTALIEDYFFDDETEPRMTTVYHADNRSLRLTHYCGARNHPQMIARVLDSEQRFIAFDFTGITNLADADDYHSRQMEVRIVNDHHVRIQYHGLQNGQVYSQAYDLRRVSPNQLIDRGTRE